MQRLRTFLLIPLLLALSGCGSIAKLASLGGPAKAEFSSLRVVALADANDGQATELDLVFTYREDIAATLPADAPAWFAQRAALQARFAGDLDVVSLAVPAGFVIEQVQLPDRHGKALQVVAYANYVAKAGQQPITLTKLAGVVLTLEKTQMVFAPAN